jgi:hypothetical protein
MCHKSKRYVMKLNAMKEKKDVRWQVEELCAVLPVSPHTQPPPCRGSGSPFWRIRTLYCLRLYEQQKIKRCSVRFTSLLFFLAEQYIPTLNRVVKSSGNWKKKTVPGLYKIETFPQILLHRMRFHLSLSASEETEKKEPCQHLAWLVFKAPACSKVDTITINDYRQQCMGQLHGRKESQREGHCGCSVQICSIIK